jgi:hypothetical protein
MYSITVVLENDNIDRMWKYDPASVVLASLGRPWSELKLKDLVITYATEEEKGRVLEMCASGQVIDALRLLSRGFQFRPDQGDYDGPYVSGLPKPGKQDS